MSIKVALTGILLLFSFLCFTAPISSQPSIDSELYVSDLYKSPSNIYSHGVVIAKFDGRNFYEKGNNIGSFDGHYVVSHGSTIATFNGREFITHGSIFARFENNHLYDPHASLICEISEGSVRRSGYISLKYDMDMDPVAVAAYLLFFYR